MTRRIGCNLEDLYGVFIHFVYFHLFIGIICDVPHKVIANDMVIWFFRFMVGTIRATCILLIGHAAENKLMVETGT